MRTQPRWTIEYIDVHHLRTDVALTTDNSAASENENMPPQRCVRGFQQERAMTLDLISVGFATFMQKSGKRTKGLV